MTIDSTFDVIRIFNALTATLVFGLLVYKFRLCFSKYNNQQKYMLLIAMVYSFASAYASVEGYAMNLGPASRVIVVLAANIVSLAAYLYYYNREDTNPPG